MRIIVKNINRYSYFILTYFRERCLRIFQEKINIEKRMTFAEFTYKVGIRLCSRNALPVMLKDLLPDPQEMVI